MIERRTLVLGFLFYIFTGTTLALVQSTIWFDFFGNIIPPALWIAVLVYTALFRPSKEGAIICASLGFLLSGLTVSPSGLVISSILATFYFLQYFKSLIFWRGLSYYAMVLAIGTSCYPIFYYYFARMFHYHKPEQFFLFYWFAQTIMTTALGAWIYYLLRWFDRTTGREELITERGKNEVLDL